MCIKISAKKKKLLDVIKLAARKPPEYRKVYFEVNQEDKTCIVAAGNTTIMNQLVINDIKIEQKLNNIESFSCDADIISNVLAEKNDVVELLLRETCEKQIEFSFLGLEKYRNVLAEAPEQVHIDYCCNNALEADFKSYDREKFTQLMHDVHQQHLPFQFVHLITDNDDNNIDRVKIQRDGEVFDLELSSKSNLNVDLPMDNKTFIELEKACNSSEDEEISISVKNDQIVFKSTDRLSTLKVQDTHDFLNKESINHDVMFDFCNFS